MRYRLIQGDALAVLRTLESFCGSGTTGLVALRYGRNFLGIELKVKNQPPDLTAGEFNRSE